MKSLELEHFLLEPMQRLTRYPLLIHQVRILFFSLRAFLTTAAADPSLH